MITSLIFGRPEVASIGRLFCRAHPRTVPWLVVSRILEAPNSCLFRTWSHIGEKVFKRISPMAANSNALGTVKREAFVPRVITPRTHREPRSVLPAVSSARSVSMTEIAMASQASATPRVIVDQRIDRDNFYSAAITQAKPVHLIADAATSGPLCSKSSKSLPGDVAKLRFWHVQILPRKVGR